jgi:hypothetical protein
MLEGSQASLACPSDKDSVKVRIVRSNGLRQGPRDFDFSELMLSFIIWRKYFRSSE